MEHLNNWPKSVFPDDLKEITKENMEMNKTQTEKFVKALGKWRTEASRIKTEIECDTEDVTISQGISQ